MTRHAITAAVVFALAVVGSCAGSCLDRHLAAEARASTARQEQDRRRARQTLRELGQLQIRLLRGRELVAFSRGLVAVRAPAAAWGRR